MDDSDADSDVFEYFETHGIFDNVCDTFSFSVSIHDDIIPKSLVDTLDYLNMVNFGSLFYGIIIKCIMLPSLYSIFSYFV